MSRFLRAAAWSLFGAVLSLVAVAGAGFWLYREAAASRTAHRDAHRPRAAAHQHCRHSGAAGREGVIRNPIAFEAVARLSGRGTSLKSGEYEFAGGASAIDALEILAQGKTVKRRLTIPEGLSSAEVAALVRDAPALDGDVGPVPAEGSLLPDTYFYSYGDRRSELIERMRRAMAQSLKQLWAERAPDLPLSGPRDAVVLASIVEKETAREEERPRVAGGVPEPAALGDAAAGRPDGALCARGGNRRQARPAADACRSRDQFALQHLSGEGTAAGADRQSEPRLAARRNTAGADRRICISWPMVRAAMSLPRIWPITTATSRCIAAPLTRTARSASRPRRPLSLGAANAAPHPEPDPPPPKPRAKPDAGPAQPRAAE